jgi:1-acyl-sn-glycerol-3-phosphate acyltransferase
VENIPEEGGVLICCNHISMHDVIVLGAASKRQIRFMAKKELFNVPLLSQFFRALGAFPVDRKKGDVGAIKHTVNMINEGHVVGLFPQGTRYTGKHPKETPIKNGAGLVVSRTKCTVVPASIKTKNFKITPFFKKVELKFGEPIFYDSFAEFEEDKDKYEKISDIIFKKIVELTD